MRKMNLVFALSALMMMSGFAFGQAQRRVLREQVVVPQEVITVPTPNIGRIPPRNPMDPCSPGFPGTVYLPCNLTIGSMAWNPARGKFDVSLDDASLRQAYAQVVQQELAQSSQDAISRRVPPPDYGTWVKTVRDMFDQVANEALSERVRNQGQGSGGTVNAMKFPPTKIDLKLDYNGGKLGGSLTLSWTIK